MLPRAISPIVHLELHTADAEDACSYYERLLGWRSERIELPAGSYVALGLGRELEGGVVECPGRRPLWLPYVEVNNVVEATDRARELGASVLLEPREGPTGWRSVIARETGGEVGLWGPKSGAGREPASA
jgi:predicted enzyme related to lactoylglutathione lyase